MPNVAEPKFIYAVFAPDNEYSVPDIYINLDDAVVDFAGRCELADLAVVRYVPDSVGTLAQPKVRYEIKKARKT